MHTSKWGFHVARLDGQGVAKAFKAWIGQKNGSTFFCVCTNPNY